MSLGSFCGIAIVNLCLFSNNMFIFKFQIISKLCTLPQFLCHMLYPESHHAATHYNSQSHTHLIKYNKKQKIVVHNMQEDFINNLSVYTKVEKHFPVCDCVVQWESKIDWNRVCKVEKWFGDTRESPWVLTLKLPKCMYFLKSVYLYQMLAADSLIPSCLKVRKSKQKKNSVKKVLYVLFVRSIYTRH